MTKNLVIVESPAKAKTINKILGAEYQVKASMGHVRDLPEKELAVDIQNGFKPRYVIIKSREKVVRELQEAAKRAQRIFLAPDPDREGEAIAWHLLEILKKKIPEDRFYRITYNEITEAAINKAFQNPGKIDQRKVDSQQARRILDRLVGYIVSPLLWRRIRGALSAGRVQSVALRLVCEREREIQNFQPQEYWVLGLRVRKFVEPRVPFNIRLAAINGEKVRISSKDEAERIRQDVENRKLVVAKITEREVQRRPQPPFITSTLQQAASSLLGFSPAKTMQIAQRLYEGMDLGGEAGPVGLITYMRTDSVRVAEEAQAACRTWIRTHLGAEFVPHKPPVYRSKATAQEAHEAIRPTDVTRTPESLEKVLSADEWKLYRLIWNRFVASQMSPAVLRQRMVEVEALPHEESATNRYLFRASASEVVFPGYLRIMGAEEVKKREEDRPEDEREDSEEPEVEALPPLTEGESLERVDWLAEQKFTQPPPRYSEATLIKALEEKGVGRPSTYAQIMSTLQERRYVVKEKRRLRPTEMGMAVNDFLVRHLGELFDVKFTANMEEKLDEIERGHVEWVSMLNDFYRDLVRWVSQAKGPTADREKVQRLLDILAHVKTWHPARHVGRRKLDDQTFVESVREQFKAGKPLTESQWEALKKVAVRYMDQLPELQQEAAALGLEEIMKKVAEKSQPPCEATIEKLRLLEKVQFAEPRKHGKQVFDDRAFVDSLRQQVASGRRLSEKQIHHLDRILMRYADQIEGFEQKAAELGLATSASSAATREEVRKLLDQLALVKEWRQAVQIRKRVWDDRAFYESVLEQFRRGSTLSSRQIAALRKLVARYRDQIGAAAAEDSSGS